MVIPVRYNSIHRYDDGTRYSEKLDDQPGNEALTLNTILEGAVGPNQEPVTVGQALRIMLAVLSGADSGAQLNSSEAQFFAPDGTTRRLRADLDGRGNRTNTDLEG